MQGNDYRVFVLLSDGECNEKGPFAGAMMAAAQNLGNLTVIIDYNKWQATGRSDEVLQLAPLAEKWQAFGWDAHEANGHDIDEISALLSNSSDRPRAIVALLRER